MNSTIQTHALNNEEAFFPLSPALSLSLTSHHIRPILHHLHHRHHWYQYALHTGNLVTPSSRSRLFLLVLAGTLGLGGTSELLGAVLPLFALLSAGLFDLGGLADTDQSVVGFEFLESLDAVVDEGEAGRFAAAVVCA